LKLAASYDMEITISTGGIMKLRHVGYFGFLFAIHVSASASPSLEPIVGLPCEGCEFVFVGMSVDVASHSRIAPEGKLGERLHLQGRVVDEKGAPVPSVVVYAYHAYRAGGAPRHSPLSAFHGDLRGWAKSDAQGYYSFDTIRPGLPVSGSEAGHIFMQVLELGRCTYSIDPVLFTDDTANALAKTDQRMKAKPERGGSGVTTPIKDSAGVWQVTRDIQLGRNIPGYEGCRQQTGH
jgi:protocatechuate 3,4-dioxygenase beta subunit